MARFVSAVTGLRLFCDKKRQEGQERRRRGRVWWAWARLQGGGGDLLACVLALLRAPRGVDGVVHLPLTRLCPRLLRGLGRFLGLHLVYRAVEVLEQLEARGEHLVEGRRPAALGVRGPEVRARQLHERLEALLASLPLPQLLLEQVGPNRHAMQLCHARAAWLTSWARLTSAPLSTGNARSSKGPRGTAVKGHWFGGREGGGGSYAPELSLANPTHSAAHDLLMPLPLSLKSMCPFCSAAWMSERRKALLSPATERVGVRVRLEC